MSATERIRDWLTAELVRLVDESPCVVRGDGVGLVPYDDRVTISETSDGSMVITVRQNGRYTKGGYKA